MSNLGAEILEGLMITLGVMIPISVWAISVLHWMIDGLIELWQGLTAIGLALVLATLVIWAPIAGLQAPIFVAILATLAVFPFAYSQFGKLDFREVDESDLTRAHDAFAANPGNVAARFEIARLLTIYGLKGHAIAISEQVAGGLPDVRDPISNRSVRDIFHHEIRRIEQWKREANPKRDFVPLACPRCKAKNPLSAIACVQCGAPYLLDLARKRTVKSRVVGKLVITWIIVAVVFTIVPIAALQLGSGAAFATISGLLIAASAVFLYLYRERAIGR